MRYGIHHARSFRNGSAITNRPLQLKAPLLHFAMRRHTPPSLYAAAIAANHCRLVIRQLPPLLNVIHNIASLYACQNSKTFCLPSVRLTSTGRLRTRHWGRKPRPGRLAPLGEETASRTPRATGRGNRVPAVYVHAITQGHPGHPAALKLACCQHDCTLPNNNKKAPSASKKSQRSPPHFSQARKGKTPAKNVKTFAPSALY